MPEMAMMWTGSPSPPPHLKVVFANNKHWSEICLHQHSTGICYFPKLWSLTKCLSRLFFFWGGAGTITLKEIYFRAHLLLAVIIHKFQSRQSSNNKSLPVETTKGNAFFLGMATRTRVELLGPLHVITVNRGKAYAHYDLENQCTEVIR